MRRAFAALGPILLLAGTACAADEFAEANLDPKIRLIAPEQGELLLRQCSRGTPPRGERYFRPRAAEIVRFETALQAALDANPQFQGEIGWRRSQGAVVRTSVRQDWGRDVVGIVRGGRQFIYGNYYPFSEDMPGGRDQPVIVCDGGPAFFGAEFDIEEGTISHLAFNGMA